MRPVCNQYNKLWLFCAILFCATVEHEQQQQLLLLLLLLLHLFLSTSCWYMGEADIIPAFVIDGGAWSESHPRNFTPLKLPQYPLNIRWVDPRDRLDITEKKKISRPCQDSISRSSSPQQGHSSNYTIPVQYCKLTKSLLTTN